MNNQPSSQIEDFSYQWQRWLEEMPVTYTSFLESVAIILLLLIFHFIIMRIVSRRVSDPAAQYKWRKNLAYTLSFIGFMMVGRIWFEGIASLATFLGLLSAGVAIALRDPLVDMAGWLFLLWRKPFAVGDRIQIGENRGDVIDVRLFKFTILEIGNWVHADQSTGRVVHIPNHQVFSDSIANYTSNFDFIWNEIEVAVTFESNWKKAKSIMEKIADDQLGELAEHAGNQIKKASRSYLIRYSYLTPIVYSDVGQYGIRLTLRHLTDPRKRRKMTMIIWEDILDRFHEQDDIAFAYPTYRLYQNQIEGKSKLKPGPDT